MSQRRGRAKMRAMPDDLPSHRTAEVAAALAAYVDLRERIARGEANWPDLADELLNRVTWKIPNALVLIGSRARDERNAMTTSWVTQLAQEPVLIGVGVDNDAVTRRLIADGGAFTVNLWNSEDTKVFVKFS